MPDQNEQISIMNLRDVAEIYLMALCIWREARGEPINVKWGVAWVIMNRVAHPGWWGRDISTVILCHYQFSSFNANDPNANRFPQTNDPAFMESLRASRDCYYKYVQDPTQGCTSYYDKSLDNNPPKQSIGKPILKIGNMRFYDQPKGSTEGLP